MYLINEEQNSAFASPHDFMRWLFPRHTMPPAPIWIVALLLCFAASLFAVMSVQCFVVGWRFQANNSWFSPEWGIPLAIVFYLLAFSLPVMGRFGRTAIRFRAKMTARHERVQKKDSEKTVHKTAETNINILHLALMPVINFRLPFHDQMTTAAYFSKLVSCFTYGHIQISPAMICCRDEKGHGLVDEAEINKEEIARQAEQLKDIMKIWSSPLGFDGLKINFEGLETTYSKIESFGRKLGINDLVNAYFTSEIPIDDLIA